MGNYYVYMHVNKENGKRYIGICSCRPEDRWRNGNGYLSKRKDGKWGQPAFANAIQKYTWAGFDHVVLLNNVCKEEAVYAEHYLIKWYKTTDPKYGYNILDGGYSMEFKGTSNTKEYWREYWRTHPEQKRRASEWKKQRRAQMNAAEHKRRHTLKGQIERMEENFKFCAKVAAAAGREYHPRKSTLEKYNRLLMELKEEANNE